MQYSLSKESVLKWLEDPSVYHIKKDELYELDDEAFEFLKGCQSVYCYAELRTCHAEFISASKKKTLNQVQGDAISLATKKFIDYCLKEGFLTKNKVSLRRPPLKKSPVPSLRYLELQITDRCNLRCRHCYINPPSPPFSKGGMGGFELSLSRITRALTEFEEIQGLRVLITGGEPLLHSRFKEINSMLPEFFVRKILFTNGLLLSKEVLKNINVDEIQISIDGLEKAHDSLRGKGTFKSAMKAAGLSIDYGFEVSISTMVHSKNTGDFDKMETLFKKIGIKEWTVDIPCVAGRLRENTDFQLSPKQAGKYLAYGYGSGIHSGEKGFGCGLHLMSVSANGKISKCTFYSDRAVGTIKDGLRKCWEKIKPVRLDKLECDCEYIEKCRGGCRYRAEMLGDAKGKDLYRCALYGQSF
ncbi:MAG: radical SAM protein [Thermodesulfovibrionales bacterium]|nr:radical SAM protein [Thermodesulfovibrionales bacterium]